MEMTMSDDLPGLESADGTTIPIESDGKWGPTSRTIQGIVGMLLALVLNQTLGVPVDAATGILHEVLEWFWEGVGLVAALVAIRGREDAEVPLYWWPKDRKTLGSVKRQRRGVE